MVSETDIDNVSLDFSGLKKRLRGSIGKGDRFAKTVEQTVTEIEASKTAANLSFVIPYLFHYGGKPISLDDYPTMEPLYNLKRPPRILMLCSRQVGKSLNEATSTLLESIWTPYLNTLFVSPFFEMVRRISTDYFAGLVQDTPTPDLFTGKGCISQVLERSFPNGSRVRFTYAHRNADRARGIHARSLKRDEVQLMHEEVLPVLAATMSSSPWGNYIFDAGTPLTNSNAASQAFNELSSRSHWMIPCRSCGKENVAALEYDLVKMIGPRRKDISRDRPAIVCANSKCGYWLFPWDGRYIHLQPEKRNKFLGLHVTQPVLPLHCCDPTKWDALIDALENPHTADYIKYNEYLGVPWDDGVSLVTETDLDKVCVLGENRFLEALDLLRRYNGKVAVGIDWGGGGINRESRTKLALMGLNPVDARLDVLFGLDLTLVMQEHMEAEHVWNVVKNVIAAVPSAIVCHDDSTFGSAKMTLIRQKGLADERIVNMSYVGETSKMIMQMRPPTPNSPKQVWSVDKARALKLVCMAIKAGKIRFFKKTNALHARSLLLDFTHLVAEEKEMVSSNRASLLLIQRMVGQSDDFAHATTFGAIGLWNKHTSWPELNTDEFQITTSQDLASYVQMLNATVDSETMESLIRRSESPTAE